MSEREVALRIQGLSKEYHLGKIGNGTLQRDLQSWWAKVRGKEDPNRRIGSSERLVGESFMALNGIDLTVHRGETLGIIGRNGAGKSTLLKIISRVTAPTEGTVEIFGKVTSMLEVGTGFHGEMTGRENIFMNGAVLGMTREEIRERMDEIIAFSEVGEYIDTPVKRYSSGMYVKLAFSVAAHLKSDIMIMDEVLAVGDVSFQKKCLNAMKKAARAENRAILYVSHNMNTIRELCDRCIVLNEGKIIFDGKTEEAIERYLDTRFHDELRMEFPEDEVFSWLAAPKIRLRSAEYPGRKDNRFTSEEEIRVRLNWRNVTDVSEVCLRAEIRSLSDVPLATYVLYDFYEGKAGETAEAEIALDPGEFVEGMYYMIYTFFRHDEAGSQENLECRYGLSFEIGKARHTGKLNWETRNWGYLNPDGIRLAGLSRGEEFR